MRRKCSGELDQWKARNEAVAASQKDAKVIDPSPATIPTTAEEKELAEATRIKTFLQVQQVL
jgi:hypothetical protein